MRGGYTLDWNDKMLSEKKITKSTYLVNKKYIELDDALDKAIDKLKKHYRKLYKAEIESAETKEDFEAIKNKLRMMPESVAKVFMFRDIILREEEKIKEKD